MGANSIGFLWGNRLRDLTSMRDGAGSEGKCLRKTSLPNWSYLYGTVLESPAIRVTSARYSLDYFSGPPGLLLARDRAKNRERNVSKMSRQKLFRHDPGGGTVWKCVQPIDRIWFKKLWPCFRNSYSE